jgi:hypothetical protein
MLSAATDATQVVLVCRNFKANNGYERPQVHVSLYPMKVIDFIEIQYERLLL